MAVEQVYIVPRRSDVGGMLLHLRDLKPNTSTRSVIVEPVGQSGYLSQGMDRPGLTTLDSTLSSYFTGSTFTSPLLVLADADVDENAANDSDVTQAAEFGLAAYIRERIDAGAAAAVLTPVQALAMANAILTAVEGGTAPTSANIDVALDSVVAGSGLALGNSFGSVVDILRILSGEVYLVPKATVIATNAGVFRTLAQRVAQVGSSTSYQVAGGFVARGTSGFRPVTSYVRTGALNLSVLAGDLAFLKGNVTFNNPEFAYSAGDVQSWKPRAVDLAGNAIPATGTHPAVLVFDADGNAL